MCFATLSENKANHPLSARWNHVRHQILHADCGICSNGNAGRLEGDAPANGVTRPRLLHDVVCTLKKEL